MIIGIDSGKSGAISVIKNNILYLKDMPIIKTSTKKTVIDIDEIINFYRKLEIDKESNTIAFLEKVWSLPNDGHVGAFSFGEAYGIIKAVTMCELHEKVTLDLVSAAVWKNHMGLTKDKNLSIDLANKLLNNSKYQPFKLKKHDGRAEAFLISLYGAFSNRVNVNKIKIDEVIIDE